ncbi:putative ubiquitin-conjugating enzyme E2 24 [Drosera capensis]
MFGGSDSDSFSETSSDCEDEISIYTGHAQSILSSLDDSIGKIDDLLTFERRLLPGDVVSLAKEPSGQLGKILNVNVLVDLENVLGKTIKGINTKKIHNLRSFSVGDYVIHGLWLGRVNRVVDSFTILFDDGSKCELTETDKHKLMPLSPNFLDDSLYPYHPGQRVKLGASSAPMTSGWICGTSRRIQQEGTIYSIGVGLVSIDWLSCAVTGINPGISPPSSFQSPKSLTLLSCFPHANWQLGDWCAYQFADSTEAAEGSYMSNFVNEQHPSERATIEREFNSKLEKMFSIVKKRTKVDVMWQDGSCSIGLDSNTLFPTDIANAHDFFPRQYVLEKNQYEDMKVPTSQTWGSVQCVDANERTVKVRWKLIDGSVGDSDEWMVETVSAYELIEHPDFYYSLGDIVFSLKGNQSVSQPDCFGASDMAGIITEANPTDVCDRCSLSCMGYVIGFKDENVEVQWASGITSKVEPNEIFCVVRDNSTVVTPGLHEGNTSGSELVPEVINHEKESRHLKEKDSLVKDMDSDNHRGYSGKSKFFGLPQVAMGFISGIAASFLGPRGSPQKILEDPAADDGEIGSLIGHQGLEHGNTSSCDEIMKIPQSIDILSSYTETLDNCKQFDVISDHKDHHFADCVGEGSSLSQNVRKGWSKKVQQEWTILEQNLPEAIYVRIYEERMDLLRAAIVGAAGTPYHDGLFFFDIFLPPEYPNEPPLVHYHSGGLRLNPNLYESGKVCLSLLNTWTGTGSEVWNPQSSTILQVLVSLQALVLNEKPYFNEAGYDELLGRIEGEKNSVSYNENALLVTCKSMLYLLRNPPKHFEGFVLEHFKNRAGQILFACKAYMDDDAPIGYAEANGTSDMPATRNSTGFKIMLAKLLPMLVEAFSHKGFDCSQFSDV